MLERELASCRVYQVHYRLKNGKKMRTDYSGDNEEDCKKAAAKLEAREDIRYLAIQMTSLDVRLFD